MSGIRCAALLLPLFLSVSTLAGAQGHGHGAHAEERLGTVRFATSCQPDVAPAFDRAVALLHSFEFGASIEAFGRVLAADSTCAMAHWGIALSRWGNPMAPQIRQPAQLTVGRAAADAAVRHAARATPRERAYAAAVFQLYADHERVDQAARLANYERAMAEVSAAHPTDDEAKIFHALALSASASPADKTYAKQLQAGELLERLWVDRPDHPGLAHYIIHSYDYPPLADRARAAAQRYAQIAPSTAHALHMPSHTFTRVGLWNESVSTNRRSMQAALERGAIGEALHAADYSVYAWLQLRQTDSVRAMLGRLPALAARFDPDAVTGAAPGSAGVFALAAIPARDALERRDWRAAAALRPAPSAFPWTEAMTYFARGLGAARLGEQARAQESVDSLRAVRAVLLRRGEGYWAEQVAIQTLAVQGWLDLARGRTDSALAHMREAADREDATEKGAVTPGPLAPARELLGDMLMQLRRPREALAEYQRALRVEQNRYHTLAGARRAAAAAGDKSAAAGYAKQLKTLTGR